MIKEYSCQSGEGSKFHFSFWSPLGSSAGFSSAFFRSKMGDPLQRPPEAPGHPGGRSFQGAAAETEHVRTREQEPGSSLLGGSPETLRNVDSATTKA